MSARVLVVDDIPVNVKLLEAKLLVEYYEVVTANDGRGAIEIARRQSPDIVLLDVMMPGMDGYETCRKLKSEPETAHIPVVMVTALNEMRDRVRGLEAGADDFLTKPVNDVALFARIRSLVRLKRASDEWRSREATAMEFGVVPGPDGKVDENAPGRVLLVEEGGWDSALVARVLTGEGHTVDIARGDEEAIAMASGGDYDMVLANDGDSGDALRLCSQLRSQKATRHGPILLIIDEGAEDRLAKAMEIGVNDYLVRPIDRDELVARTRTQVRRKRYEDRLRANYVYSVNAAVTDSLTGMYNRRYLESHFERICGRMQGSEKQISLLMLDIDHFKEVNDTHGHVVGDEVLQAIARRILSNLRGFDTAIRYGGEEFVVLLPDATVGGAVAAGNRLCKSVSASAIPISISEEGLAVTVSIGIANAIAGTESLDQMLKRADIALYEAKNAGRNRVVVAEAGGPVENLASAPPARAAG
jgi:two-component system, cell cycle response regulator